MQLSTANGLIRNAELAQNLLNDGIRLPPDTLPTAVKPLAGLPDAEGLRSVCWNYAQSLSPARTPSSTVISRVVRLIRFELDDACVDPETKHDSEPSDTFSRADCPAGNVSEFQRGPDYCPN
jgi:hypothetical protein